MQVHCAQVGRVTSSSSFSLEFRTWFDSTTDAAMGLRLAIPKDLSFNDACQDLLTA